MTRKFNYNCQSRFPWIDKAGGKSIWLHGIAGRWPATQYGSGAVLIPELSRLQLDGMLAGVFGSDPISEQLWRGYSVLLQELIS